MLAGYIALYIGLDYGHHRADLAAVLPHYLTYFNHLAPIGPETPFPQSWSLGVEEKFYLLWPALAFVLWRMHPGRRFLGALGLVLLPVALWPFHSFAWYVPYSNIMVGCVLAICLHHRPGFQRVRVLAGDPWLWLGFAALVGAHFAAARLSSDLAECLYPFVAAAFIVGVLLGDAPGSGCFGHGRWSSSASARTGSTSSTALSCSRGRRSCAAPPVSPSTL